MKNSSKTALGGYPAEENIQKKIDEQQNVNDQIFIERYCSAVLYEYQKGEIKSEITAIKLIHKMITTTYEKRQNIHKVQMHILLGKYTNYIFSSEKQKDIEKVTKKEIIIEVIDYLRDEMNKTTDHFSEKSAFRDLHQKLANYGIKVSARTLQDWYYKKPSRKI